MSQLKLYLFGPPRLARGKQLIEFDLRKGLALFVYLSSTRQPHTRDALATVFWAEASQREARANLRRTLYRVTETLGKDLLILSKETIEVNPQYSMWLDTQVFREHVRAALPEDGLADYIDDADLARLIEAAALYTDEFMAGFSLPDSPSFDEWQFFQRETMRQLLCRVVEQLAHTYQRQGEFAKGVPYIRRRLALEPLHEPAHRHLMQLYAWSGQHAAARRQYEECVRILAEELDAPPEDATTALFETIRTKQLAPPVAGPAAPARSPLMLAAEPIEPALPRHNLPFQPTPFVGRAKELAEVRRLLQEESTYRLLTLCGPGGIGKSRLSLMVATQMVESFTDGIWLVELAPLASPALVAQSVASVVGAPESPDRPLLTTLTGYLRHKNLLLILDNCEHLITACAELVDALLRNCPQVHLLATSREAFGVAGEVTFVVPPLSLPDMQQLIESGEFAQSEAERLFVDRARAVLPDFKVTEANAAAVAQLCHRLDGIPLAIELAAARVRMLRVEQITARLDDRFRLLTGGSRTALPRHQTLQALIDWSYELLSAPERVLFRMLAVFAGGWRLEAVEAACAASDGMAGDATFLSSPAHSPASFLPPAADVLDLLGQLVNKSLVVADRKQGAETRYRLLETIRQYARQKLLESGGEAFVRRQHLAYYLSLAEQAAPHLRGPEQVMWLDYLEAEHDNLRTALEWALANDVGAALRLATALLWLWHIRGHRREGREWLARGLAAEQDEHEQSLRSPVQVTVRAHALTAAANLANMTGDLQRADALAQEGIALLQTLASEDKPGMANALWTLSTAAAGQGRVEQASGLIEASLTLFRAVGDTFGAAQCLSSLGRIVMGRGDFERSRLLLEEHLLLRREFGDLDGMADALGHLGTLAFWQGDYKAAQELYEESLAGFRKVGNRWAMGFTLYAMGELAQAEGDYELAIRKLEASLAFGRDITDKHVMAMAHYQLGAIAWSQGEYEQAAACYEDALVLMREHGNIVGAAKACNALGEVAFVRAAYAQARRWYEEALTTGKKLGHHATRAVASYGLGKLAQTKGDYGLARRLYKEALRIQNATGQTKLTWRRETRDPWGIPRFLEALAFVDVSQQEMGSAARLFGATAKWHQVVHFLRSPAERSERESVLAAVRADLAAETYASLWFEGETMSLTAAIASAS